MKSVLSLLLDRLSTPIGDLHIVADREGNLRATFWTDEEEALRRVLERHSRGRQVEPERAGDPHGLTSRLAAYFAGELHAIDSLPVETAGTAFQREVWRGLREIPCGTTLSYGE